MILFYDERDLVSFGTYLLSETRKTQIEKAESTLSVEERLSKVWEADINNWVHFVQAQAVERQMEQSKQLEELSKKADEVEESEVEVEEVESNIEAKDKSKDILKNVK